MEARLIHKGEAIEYTPTVDTPAGTVVVVETLVGVTKLDIPAGVLGALAMIGVFDVAKAIGAGTAIAMGIEVYWDDTAKVATFDPTGNKLMGKAVADAGDDDAIVRVRL